MKPHTSFRASLFMLSYVAVLAIFFAQVEIQIEGAAGWGANLPTWRIQKHWLLDLFWGGRAMTGYHAWVFPFIALFFHFPFFLTQPWSWRTEARVFAAGIVFWIIEDCMWFVMNPAWGWEHFNQATVTWHHHWLWGTPIDYWIGSAVAFLLLAYATRPPAGTQTSAIST